MQNTSSYYHVMIKPAGAACNARCTYCFYAPKQKARARMISGRTLETFVRQYIESQPCSEITFAWQGGEPTLLGLDFFKKAVRLEQKYAPPGKRISNTLQTNGLLLDDGWCSFLHDHRFLVGISIDGPQPLHDTYRRGPGGEPTFGRVMRSIGLLQRHGVEYNTLTTLTRANAAHPLEVYRFLRDSAGARYMQFIPCVEPVGFEAEPPAAAPRTATAWSVDPAAYGDFLIALFDEWLARDVGTVFVLLFDALLGLWLGMPSATCIFASDCGASVALESDGSVYSCDHYVYPGFRLGNINEKPLAGILASGRQRRFGAAKSATLPRYCRECAFLFVCRGECPKNRIAVTPSGEPGLNYLCTGLRKFFAHIDPWMKRMAAGLRAGQPADSIMPAARTELPRDDSRAGPGLHDANRQ